MNPMTGMGPEELLVRSKWKADPRVALAEYAVRDSSRTEVRAVDEMLRRELAFLPVRHSVARRLLRWGRKRLRWADLPLAVGPAVWRERAEAPGEGAVEEGAFARATLAALPAMQAGARREGAGRPISAVPVYARD